MKNILILGASSDIGIQVVENFLNEGWNVTAHYNSKNIFKKKKFKNKNLSLLKFDLTNILSFEKFLKKNSYKFSKFDAFVSLTGYLKRVSFKNFNSSDIYNHFNVNFLSNILLIKVLLKGMKKRKYGRILLTSSIGTKFGGGLNSFAYSLSKFNNEFFPSYYKSLYSKNIIINTLQIGVTDTKIHKNLKGKNMKNRISLIPLKRMATKKEVSDYILFLCNDKNKILTGSVINISGGE